MARAAVSDRIAAPALFGGTPVRPAPIPPRVVISDAIRRRINEQLDRGTFSDWRGGPAVRELERAFADFHGSGYECVALNSGTSALHLAVAALGIGPGDEVIMPCAAYVSAASAVVQEGGVPVICDVDPVSTTMDLADAERRITSRTKALLPVHFWGCPTDMTGVQRLADKYSLAVIEDCGQSHGATADDRVVGSFGDVSAYSFAPRKHISTGQGGAVVTPRPEVAAKMRSLANKGKGLGWLDYQTVGYSYVLPDLEALVGLNGLAQLGEEIERRRRFADIYREVLDGSIVDFWQDPAWGRHVYFKMPLALHAPYAGSLQTVIDAISAENVSCRPTHPPLSSIGWLAEYMRRNGVRCDEADLPASYAVLPRVFEVETGPGLDEDDMRESAAAVRKVLDYIEANPDL
jgi:perosamine synthetase